MDTNPGLHSQRSWLSLSPTGRLCPLEQLGKCPGLFKRWCWHTNFLLKLGPLGPLGQLFQNRLWRNWTCWYRRPFPTQLIRWFYKITPSEPPRTAHLELLLNRLLLPESIQQPEKSIVESKVWAILCSRSAYPTAQGRKINTYTYCWLVYPAALPKIAPTEVPSCLPCIWKLIPS